MTSNITVTWRLDRNAQPGPTESDSGQAQQSGCNKPFRSFCCALQFEGQCARPERKRSRLKACKCDAIKAGLLERNVSKWKPFNTGDIAKLSKCRSSGHPRKAMILKVMFRAKEIRVRYSDGSKDVTLVRTTMLFIVLRVFPCRMSS